MPNRLLAGLAAGLVLLAAQAAPAVDQPPGERFEIRPADMPPPRPGHSASNGPQVIDRPADATLRVPEGFTANVFAEGLSHPREFEVLPNGDVLVSEPRAGQITLLRDTDGDGTADLVTSFADGFLNPYGMALQGDTLYVADGRGVFRMPYQEGATRPGAPPRQVTPTGALGSSGGHWTRCRPRA